MSLQSADIKNIAHLARLDLDEKEIALYTQQLSNILNFIAQMNETDTDSIAPLAHPVDLCQRRRPDTVSETNLRDKYQKLAPQVEAGLYLVPKVIDEA